jgi:hypothetical protein
MLKYFSIFMVIFLAACSFQSRDKNEVDQSQRLNTQQHIMEQANTLTPLPFQDFKERWNAVADEQQSNLRIQKLEKVTTENGSYYTSAIPGNMELRVYPTGDVIQQLEIISHGKTRTDVINMLQGWSQMVTILYPNVPMPDVDGLFNLIGVGPNADLSTIKKKSFVFSGINYEVIPTDDGFVFRAAYANQ